MKEGNKKSREEKDIKKKERNNEEEEREENKYKYFSTPYFHLSILIQAWKTLKLNSRLKVFVTTLHTGSLSNHPIR